MGSSGGGKDKLKAAAKAGLQWAIKAVGAKVGLPLGAIFIIICLVIFLFIASLVAPPDAQAATDSPCLAGSSYVPNAPGYYGPNPTVITASYAVAVQKNADARATLALFEALDDESGFKVLANTKVPESATIPHDVWQAPPGASEGSDGLSVGTLQQQVGFGWGTAAQSMDPGYAAGIFLDRAIKVEPTIPGDAATLAQAVQISGTPDGSNYRAEESAAQGWIAKAASGQVGNSGAGSTDGSAAGGATCTSPASLLVTNHTVTFHSYNTEDLQTTGDEFVLALPADASGATNEAGNAMLAAVTQVDKKLPYTWGGGTFTGPSFGFDPKDGNPKSVIDGSVFGFDCSGLMLYAVAQGTNQRIHLSHDTKVEFRESPDVTTVSKPAPGDLIFFDADSAGLPGHVTMYLGKMKQDPTTHVWTSTSDGSGTDMMAEAPTSGQLLAVVPVSIESPIGYGHVDYHGSVAVSV